MGPEAVDGLEGSAQSRQRLRVLLEVLSGKCRIVEACERLGLSEPRLAQLRLRALRGALEALEPKQGGRPRRSAEATPEQVQALQARVAELELALRLAQARAEVAEITGGVGRPITKQRSRRRGKKSSPPGVADEPPGCVTTDDGGEGATASLRDPGMHAAAVEVRRRERGHRGARGRRRQRPGLAAEAARRRCLLAASAWAGQRGWRAGEVARRLSVSPRSLRRWAGQEVKAVPRGRPVVRAGREAREAVIEQLAEHGAGVSVARLRAAAPGVRRAEAADLRGRYRRMLRDQKRGRLARLCWTRPGAVWAADFAWPPEVIEGRYPRLVSVRDLASGMQLAWQPSAGEAADSACAVLGRLFREHGAPLVLKLDNGPAFLSAALERLLSQNGVEVLHSPRYTPQYNGSVEAGVGAMKGRTEACAARRGSAGGWTWEDAECARQESNDAPVGRRASSPTRQEVWEARAGISAEARAAFAAEVSRQRGGGPPVGLEGAEVAGGAAEDQGSPCRVALRRALVALGYLVFSWRRIPLQVGPKKTDNIT